MKTHDDDVTQFATTMLLNRRSRRNLLRAGAAALAAAAVGSFDAIAAPLEPATTPEPDPWESGACDDAAQAAAAAGTALQTWTAGMTLTPRPRQPPACTLIAESANLLRMKVTATQTKQPTSQTRSAFNTITHRANSATSI